MVTAGVLTGRIDFAPVTVGIPWINSAHARMDGLGAPRSAASNCKPMQLPQWGTRMVISACVRRYIMNLAFVLVAGFCRAPSSERPLVTPADSGSGSASSLLVAAPRATSTVSVAWLSPCTRSQG
jgi:hypothetical protein